MGLKLMQPLKKTRKQAQLAFSFIHSLRNFKAGFYQYFKNIPITK
jgi:hypothetical protein